MVILSPKDVRFELGDHDFSLSPQHLEIIKWILGKSSTHVGYLHLAIKPPKMLDLYSGDPGFSLKHGTFTKI